MSATCFMKNDRSQLVSIVIPTYNSSSFLPLLFDSLTKQTHRLWEAIFVDNSSQDDTLDQLHKFAKEDVRVKVFQKPYEPNPTPSRNLALQVCLGTYIAFCDSDDFWHPQKLELQVKAFEDHPEMSLIFTDRLLSFERSFAKEGTLNFFDPSLVKVSVRSKCECLYFKNKITHSSTLTKKCFLEKVGFFEQTLVGVDDYHLYLKLSTQGSVGYIDLPLTYYYMHEHNLSKNKKLMAKNLLKLARFSLKDPHIPFKVRPLLWAQSFKSLIKAYMV